MKNIVFKIEIFLIVIMLMVMVGLSCLFEMWNIVIVKVVIFSLWLKVMCIMDGGVLFYGNIVL